ncbi:THxN family PEP-CTERM protein [Sphaerothrix gracilis]|uniref:THxN family PEP-CTERM protein n=1 Tax=Sphaerothrix gracilis TaxID=3151835 RepID=UPI0031FC4287
MKLRNITVATCLGWVACMGAANAVFLTTSGTWSDTTGTAVISGEGTSQISWGIPSNPENAQSSYIFEGVTESVEINDLISQNFLLGEFTHNNRTISGAGGSLSTAVLNVDLTLDAFSQLFSFDFSHNETTNQPVGGICPDGGIPPCPDVVSFPNAVSDQFITLEGVDYNLTLIGFSQDGGSTLVENFLTLEAASNEAGLYARLTEVTDSGEPVPEPTGFLGLMAVSGAAIALKRRQQLT